MKFKITRDVENRIFSTKIEFTGFGNDTMLAEKEIEMFKDFGYPVINVGGQFVAGAGEGADQFVTPEKKVEVREGFAVTYSVSLSKVAGATDEAKIAAAIDRAEAFETEIKARLDVAIAAIKPLGDEFIEGSPELFEI